MFKKGKIYVHPYVDVRMLAGALKVAGENSVELVSLSAIGAWCVNQVGMLHKPVMSIEEAIASLERIKEDVAFMTRGGNSLAALQREIGGRCGGFEPGSIMRQMGVDINGLTEEQRRIKKETEDLIDNANREMEKQGKW